MVSWGAFARAEPDFVRLAEDHLDRDGLLLLGTKSKDGWPRISPVEPVFTDGELWLGMMWQSKKALDLLRDPRCLVHNVITDRSGSEGEFKVRGRAVDVPDAEARERYALALEAKIEWRPEGPYHLFTLAVEEVARITREGEEQRVRVWRAP